MTSDAHISPDRWPVVVCGAMFAFSAFGIPWAFCRICHTWTWAHAEEGPLGGQQSEAVGVLQELHRPQGQCALRRELEGEQGVSQRWPVRSKRPEANARGGAATKVRHVELQKHLSGSVERPR